MLIKILKETKAASCPLGLKSKLYKKGEIYDIFPWLANVFIKNKWGVVVDNKDEEKSIEKAQENKAIEKAPENKGLKKSENNKKQAKPRKKTKYQTKKEK